MEFQISMEGIKLHQLLCNIFMRILLTTCSIYLLPGIEGLCYTFFKHLIENNSRKKFRFQSKISRIISCDCLFASHRILRRTSNEKGCRRMRIYVLFDHTFSLLCSTKLFDIFLLFIACSSFLMRLFPLPIFFFFINF